MELVNGNFRRHSITQKWRRKGGIKEGRKEGRRVEEGERVRVEGRKGWEERRKERGIERRKGGRVGGREEGRTEGCERGMGKERKLRRAVKTRNDVMDESVYFLNFSL